MLIWSPLVPNPRHHPSSAAPAGSEPVPKRSWENFPTDRKFDSTTKTYRERFAVTNGVENLTKQVSMLSFGLDVLATPVAITLFLGLATYGVNLLMVQREAQQFGPAPGAPLTVASGN